MIMYVETAKNRHAIGDCFLEMVNEVPKKDEIYVVAPSCYQRDEFSEGFYKLIFESFFGNGKIKSKILAVKFSLLIRSELKKHKIDKVFIFSEGEWFNIFLYLATIGMGIRWYVYIHDPLSHEGEQKRIKLVKKFISNTIIKKAEKIFASYNGAKEELLEYYDFIDEKNIVINYLPRMKQMEFPRIRDEIKQTDTFEYDVIFFGRLEKYKGLDCLFESIRVLKSKYSVELRLLVVGSSGTEKDYVIKEMDKLHGSKFIKEYLSAEKLAEEIAKSKMAVLPYRNATGTLGIQIANYYRKPVITSYVGSFKEYVIPGENGISIKGLEPESLADNIYLLLTDEEYYKKIVSSIDKVLEEYFNSSKFSLGIFNAIDG